MSKSRVWLLFGFTAFIFWGFSLKFGFSQDDYYHLSISVARNLSDFLGFFNPASHDWIFFRPLSTQLWYFLFSTIFGISSAPFFMHLGAILLHSTNGFLIYSILRRHFHAKKHSALILALLYLISSIHFLSLYYIGATQEILMILFSLLAIDSHLKGSRTQAAIFFFFALLSKELAIRLIPFILVLDLVSKESLVSSLKRIMPYASLSLIYLAIRYLSGLTVASEYLVSFSPGTTLATIMWYLLMTLGAPEQILRYGLSGGMIDLAQYLVDYPVLAHLNLLSIALVIVILTVSLKKSSFFKTAILWLIPLFPIIFLPTHRYAHYLDLSFFALLIMLVQLPKKRLYLLAFFFTFAFTTAHLIDYQSHWTISRSIQAREYRKRLESGSACLASSLVFLGTKDDLTQLSYSLMNEHGPRIICNNPDLAVYYLTKEELENLSITDDVVIKLDNN